MSVLHEIDKIESRMHSVIDAAVCHWFRAQAANPFAAYYLYYREAREGETVAVPIIAEDKPDGYTLADPRRISPAWTVQKAHAFCFDVLRKCPILG